MSTALPARGRPCAGAMGALWAGWRRAVAGMAALRRSVVSPAGRHTASLIFLHGSGGCSGPGRGAGARCLLGRAGKAALCSGAVLGVLWPSPAGQLPGTARLRGRKSGFGCLMPRGFSFSFPSLEPAWGWPQVGGGLRVWTFQISHLSGSLVQFCPIPARLTLPGSCAPVSLILCYFWE